ncbi:universal stress protein [Xanthomarina sp. F2636L]|uniref:universal stress protein n=1 Tax=Xanthomarina sp. F2636L TaxID=2996018 RepID=UPI00225DD696|nr:universal stress protein [Xanthomarina sp. F2636L]MCX7551738.1 universal stress protein [Xanthomarina sp. F2636L]
MKKILLPTDFSENSWNAISYALQLFKDEKCTFYLLHTYTPIVYHLEYVMMSASQIGLEDIVKQQALKSLEDFEKRINEQYNNPNHSFKGQVVFNTLTLEVAEQVKEHQIDYVIMGTKGATGAKEVLFGSNAVHIFKQAKCPVLAIPDSFNFEAPSHILFPTDYEIDYKNEQVKPLVELSKMHQTKINVLNVSYGRDLASNQQKNKATLSSLFKDLNFEFFSVKNQEITQAISDFQAESPADMLIMINNKHSFFENLFFKSTISQIGFHLNIPFLVIPAKARK